MNSIRHSVRHSIARMGGSRLVGLRWIWGGNSALDSWGWFESLRTGVPCDRNGSPIPWISYPAVFILRDRVKSTFRVFEFGSGYSTLWWAKNVAHVTSCEHDADWSRTIAKDAPDNVTLL